MVVVVVTGGGAQVEHVGDVEGRALGVRLHRVVDRRLEAALEDDEVGLGHLGGLPHGQLEVVRLAAGGGEVRDLRVLAGHPLGDVLEGVERRRHLDAVVEPGRVVGQGGAPGQGEDEGDGEQGSHENDSQMS